MFKHISPHPWTTGTTHFKKTVWGYEGKFGQPRVADCFSKLTPLLTQRANARLISIAPQMFELIQTLTNNEEAMRLVRFMEADNENTTNE